MVSMKAVDSWSSAAAMASSRVPKALCTVPRDTPADSATAVRLKRRGPSWRSVSAAAESNGGGSVLDSAATGTCTHYRNVYKLINTLADAPRYPDFKETAVYDLAITGGTVVDGTGADRYPADIGIR